MNPDIHPIEWTRERILAATGGNPICVSGDRVFHGVSIDSRTIGTNDLFVAITGQNHDGHRFVSQVLDQGVRGFVLNNKNAEAIALVKEKNGLCVVVEDTTKALGQLASFQRQESGVRLVAITGSNGKTSTRAMTAAVLEQQFTTLSTQGNFNNDIGLPLTLLRLSREHQWAVVEMGMNAPGEIARLAAIAKPDLGIITNVAAAHLEGLGSIENVAKAKAELFDALEPGCQALINVDDSLVAGLENLCRCEVMTFGTAERARIRAMNIRIDRGKVTFDLHAQGNSIPVALNTPGRFMVSNALAAAATGILAGLDLGAIKKGLESFEPVYGRMRILNSPRGFFVIDDTYNANPSSMMAAIGTLCDLKEEAKGILVAGDMRELGNETDDLHRSVGAFAAHKKVDGIYGFGEKAQLIISEAVRQGLRKESVFTGSKKEIIASLSKKLENGDWVLVKGSRTMAMEEIVKELMVLNGA